MFLLFISLLQFSVFAQQQVDLSKADSIKNVAAKIASNLITNYFDKGLIAQRNGNSANGFQSYEGGLFYGLMMDYTKITKDVQYSTKLVNGLTKESYGQLGSFLGTNHVTAELGGKWNDDLLWWSMPALTGAEVFGANTVMPGGVSYLKLADNTYQQVIADMDNACGGGIYWIRSLARKGKTPNDESYGYKSSITQFEAILHAAKLGALTGNKQYFSQADAIYKWMMSTGLITSSFDVLDGTDAAPDAAKGQCSQSALGISYESGMASGALAILSSVTKDTKYIATAQSLFTQAQKRFTQNGIVYDPCESSGKCDLNKAQPKGTLVRGWGMLHEYSSDPQIKSQIKTLLSATISQMLQTCDSQWNCGNDWTGGSLQKGGNVHFQMNALELVNAYYKTFFNGPVGAGSGLTAPTDAGQPDSPAPPFNASHRSGVNGVCVVVLIMLSSYLL